jgi:hypothetical protein
MVEFILRQRARGKVGHVDHEALDDGPYDDQQEQGRCYLERRGAALSPALRRRCGQTIRTCCRFAEADQRPPVAEGNATVQVTKAVSRLRKSLRPVLSFAAFASCLSSHSFQSRRWSMSSVAWYSRPGECLHLYGWVGLRPGVELACLDGAEQFEERRAGLRP